MLDYIDQQHGNPEYVNLGEIMFSKYKIQKQKAEESYLRHHATTEEEKIIAILRDNKEPNDCMNILLDGYGKIDELKKYYRTISHKLDPVLAEQVYKTTNYSSGLYYAKFIAYYNMKEHKYERT
jgi:hypothetical protein